MAVYTLFGQTGGGPLQADNTAYTLGVQFSVSVSGATLTAIWWYSVASAVSVPCTIALYQVSGTSLVTSQGTPSTPVSWSGAAGTGWVRATFTSPPALVSGTAYKAAILGGLSPVGNWYSATSGYWTTGAGGSGITSGPVSAPASAGASPGQDSYNQGTTLAYPGTTGNGGNYWIDLEVTVPSTGPVPPLISQRTGLY